ncbi:IclR family transcriptional regulator [Microbacterium oleivorans]|uniref:IclR family transcriptional regulator n=1 Tax=Microbacterium oleivorans TaxID=273677 RepID=A0A7D5FAL2_9MICO|nr:IclR family transcriptional regulator [Microbacterium oleivorans]QLD12789.1 IclR family transcriptional regulator [Microbacterium oleivorans]
MALAEDVANAMHTLELLASRPEGRRVSEIAERLDVNKAIAHRLLAALMQAGYVFQDARTSSYVATHSLGALGLRQLSSSGVGTWAQRSLDSLAADCEELVRLAVATNDTLQWIAKAQGSNSSLRLDPVMGQDVVPHATASGKAWLSTLSAERIETVLDQEDRLSVTSRSALDRPALSIELDEVRHRGYATTFEEMDLGINAVAAPIFGAGAGREATGTISIAGPSVRMTRARMAELSPLLLASAADIAKSWPSYAYLMASEELSA